MNGQGKIKEKLEAEVEVLRQRIAELEESHAESRREAEKARERQDFLQSVIDAVAEPVLVVGMDYRVTFMNRAAREFSGVEDPVYCYQAFHHNEMPCHLVEADYPCTIEAVKRTGGPANLAHGHFRKDGELRDAEIIASPLRDKSGNLIGVIEFMRDDTERKRAEEALYRAYEELEQRVYERTAELKSANEELRHEITERKQAEAELRESEEKYRSLVENINIGVFRNTGDFHGRFLQANPAVARMFGFDSADEMLDVSVSSLYQKSENRKDYLDEMQRTGFLQSRELRLKKKDGTPILASCTATAHFNDKGEIEWMDGVIEDITERRRAEEAIRASSQKIADILESISDAFFALDHQWRFTYVNSIAEKLLRKSREELVGKHIWEEFPEAVGSTFYTEYHKALNEDVPVSFEEYYPPLDTWYDVRAYPYHGGLSVYFHDINARKEAEAKLKMLTEELKRSNQELWHFASVAAHDLQSPLISMGSALQLLRRRLKGTLDQEADGFITHTQKMAADIIRRRWPRTCRCLSETSLTIRALTGTARSSGPSTAMSYWRRPLKISRSKYRTVGLK
jgi:PAS domain S-box-containing protein